MNVNSPSSFVRMVRAMLVPVLRAVTDTWRMEASAVSRTSPVIDAVSL